MPRLGLLLNALAAAAALGCVEGPFERRNPNDHAFTGTLSLVASRDTVSPVDSLVQLQVVSDKPIATYVPLWESSDTLRLRHVGNGVFKIIATPVGVDQVTVRARFLGPTSPTRIIYRKP